MGIPHLPHSRTLVTLATVALCALFLARGTGTLLASGAAPRPVAVPKAKPAATAETGVRDVQKILTRNIFCSTCKAPEPAGPDAPRGTEPLTGLPLRLIATLVSEEDPAWSFAAVQHTESGTTGLYSCAASHDTPLPGGVLITDIEERQILVARDGRVGTLKLEAETAAQDTRPPVALGVGDELTRALSAGIRKIGDGRYEVDRAMLNRVLQNTSKLATSAFIRPQVDKRGKPAGFAIYRIRPNSLYALLGLRNGDVVNAVNGRPMLTPEVALTFFTKLRHMSHLTVSFARRGGTVTHDYTIR